MIPLPPRGESLKGPRALNFRKMCRFLAAASPWMEPLAREACSVRQDKPVKASGGPGREMLSSRMSGGDRRVAGAGWGQC